MRLLPRLALVTLLVGCSAGGIGGPNLSLDDLPATVTLSVGEAVQIGGAVVRLAAIPSDSRCPSDVVCPWEGNAELELRVGPAMGRGPEHVLTLNTSLEPRAGSTWGLTLRVLRLTPTPVSTRPTTGYRAEILVTVAAAE